MENYVTLLLDPGRPIYNPSFAYGVLRRFLPEEKVESVRGLALTIDKKVIPSSADDLDTYLAGNGGEVRLVVVRHIQLSSESTRLLQSPCMNSIFKDKPITFLDRALRLKKSMLVVSEFIGCSPSLSGAIRVNPLVYYSYFGRCYDNAKVPLTHEEL
ncbi:DEAD-box ATP-dependent RNA helicase 7 [Tanacetum coccineum]